MITTELEDITFTSLITSVGHISLWPSDVIPENWKICNGELLKIDEYPELYSIISSNFTPDNNIELDKFALPNLVEKIAIGKTSDDKIGKTIGDNLKRIEKKHLPDHTHSVSVTGGNHNHGGNTGAARAYNSLNITFAYNTNEEGDNADRIVLTGDHANKGGTANNMINIGGLDANHHHPINESGNLTFSGTATSFRDSSVQEDFDVRQLSIALNYIIKVK
jgi:microcystin-dependent protein